VPWRAKLVFLALALFVCLPLPAMQRAQGWCQLGAQKVLTTGISSSNSFRQDFPSCTATIYITNTLTLATIFSDNVSTPKSNPFTSSATGVWFFYAANGRYDVSLTGGGIAGTITYPDVLLNDTGGAIASLNGLTAATQTFATGTSGSDFNIASVSSTHTFNLPTASSTNRGLLASADWTTFNGKQAPLSFTAPLVNTSGTISITFPHTIVQGGTNATTQTVAFNNLSPLTTKGDLLATNGTNNVRFAAGADSTILTADSTQGLGLRWATCALCGLTSPFVVANGGTGLTAFTSGGIPYASSASTLASSAVLAAGGLVIGGGAGGAPTTTGVASLYNGQTLVGNGVSAVVGYATAAASGASITTTNLVASAPVGLYRITAYLATSTAGSGNVVTTLGWTDAVGAKTSATPATLTMTSGTFVTGTITVQVAASSNITYATAWTSTGQYNIYVVAERLQ
jgi:hypothetical protein